LDFVVEAVAFFVDAFVLIVMTGVFGFDEPLTTFSFAGVFGVLVVDFGVLAFAVLTILVRRGVFVG